MEGGLTIQNSMTILPTISFAEFEADFEASGPIEFD